MNKAIVYILVSLMATIPRSHGQNGKYYVCDTTALSDENLCIFALSGEQPDEWTELGLVEHNIDRTVGEDFHRGVQDSDGTMLTVTPAPWDNGDTLAASADAITGDLWTYALIFELIAPLRDMMMYNPTALFDADVWALYTRALTDCNVKTEDLVLRGGKPYSTSQVYEFLIDPEGQDIHHYILQYLEEGAIEVVCLATDLEMAACDVIRATAGATGGVDRCNCWFDAYKAIYGVCPNVDMTFTQCSGTIASSDCADDGSTGELPEEVEDPEEPTEAPEATSEMPEKGSKGQPSRRR